MTPLSQTLNHLSSSRYLAPVVSGVLLGLSFPSYPFIRLELLAWIALAPLLLSLRHVEQFGELLRRIYLTTLLFCVISLWWVSLATLSGGVLTVVMQACFMTVPLMFFYAIKKMAGYRFALVALPFLWVAWEWLYMQQELSFGWLTLGNSQANLTSMIQYADITGVWGISFWLLWFNVLFLIALTSNQQERHRLIVIMIAMVITPLLYAWYLSSAEKNASHKADSLRVTLVQPNIDPHEPYEINSVMEHYNRMSSDAIRLNKPDLVIWPETAILFSLLDPLYATELSQLRSSIQQWQTAILSGCIDTAHGGNQLYSLYNASILLDPSGGVQTYHKIHLVPFGERVPYIDYLPSLGELSFALSGIRGWEKGDETTVMKLSSPNGEIAFANIICYESIFPSFVAEFVRKGARMLTLITNDGWYATSYGPYQHLAIGRLRCIENRRAMARCANTGVTVVFDKFGRTLAEIPWWQQQTLSADVPLSSELTFYTRYPDVLPKSAVGVSALFFIAAFIRRKSKAL
jgi:apolipoprotein N-acyltransferase